MDYVRQWILFSVWAHWTGWVLSACHALTSAGYALAAVPLVVTLLVSRPVIRPRIRPAAHWLPRAFWSIAALSLLGGLLYGPGLYDFHAYRFPRMLYWINERAWCWIPDGDARMNVMGAGQEWLLLPLLLWTRSQAVLFVPAFLSFVMMPGLLFQLFRQSGATRRSAWHWMWLLPLAFGYVLQSGAASNDIIGSTYALAALVYATRFADRWKPSDLATAIAAMALATSVKPTNAPLALPVLAILFGGSRRWSRRTWGTAFGTGLLCLPASYVPHVVALLSCARHGLADQTTGLVRGGPAVNALANLYNVVVAAAWLPANPLAGVLSRPFVDILRGLADGYAVRLSAPAIELVTEDAAGLGVGVTLLLALVAAAHRRAAPVDRASAGRRRPPVFWWAAASAAAVLLTTVQAGSAGRLFLPFYPLGVAGLLAWRRTNPPSSLCSLRWRLASLLCVAMAATVVILNPSRPLWPALTVANWLAEMHGGAAAKRLRDAYTVYRHRPDALAPVRDALRPNDRRIAFVGTGDDPTSALWLPLGTRRVTWVPREDLADTVRLPTSIADCDVLVANAAVLDRYVGDVVQWSDAMGWKVESTVEARTKLSDDRILWHVIRLRPDEKH